MLQSRMNLSPLMGDFCSLVAVSEDGVDDGADCAGLEDDYDDAE